MVNFGEYKKSGNDFFNEKNYENALSMYNKALDCAKKDDEKLLIYKNLSILFLKLEKNDDALNYCNLALQLDAKDLKTLLRRSSIYESQNKIAEAFKDLLKANLIDKNNKFILKNLSNLKIKLNNLHEEKLSIIKKIRKMFELINSDTKSDQDQAVKNLIALSDENGFCENIEKLDGFQLIKKKLEDKKVHFEIKFEVLRLLSEICKHGYTLELLKTIKLDFILNFFDYNLEENFIAKLQHLIQTIISSLAGIYKKNEFLIEKKILEKNEYQLNDIMTSLFEKCDNRLLPATSRDAILQLCGKNVGPDVLNWGLKAVNQKLFLNLLDIASEIEDTNIESGMRITSNTKNYVSLVLDKIYRCLEDNKSKDEYKEAITLYLNSFYQNPVIVNKIRAILIITVLLNGPLEIGNHCFARDGLIEIILALAKSDELLNQKVALEAIIAACSKKDKCTSIVSKGGSILKQLCDSKEDSIKLRALLSLCKISSCGGSDASFKLLDENIIYDLFQLCFKFIKGKDDSNKVWAVEALAFISLNASIKEKLVYLDIRSLIDLCNSKNMNMVYGLVTIFVNLTNSYDKQEILPEMIELAKLAKQPIPKEGLLDEKNYVLNRCKRLLLSNITTALVNLSKTESKSCREMISRVFNSICEIVELRGMIVQGGGSKALINLATQNNTEKGKMKASQALARIAISIDPENAFPGERSTEIIKPLLTLLDINCNALENFESLMALTNIAQINISKQNTILKNDGYSKIEHYIYEDHEYLRRASVQCLSNLIIHPEVVKKFEGKNDRLKYFVALCEFEDLETVSAAAGALAMITNVSKICCEKVFEYKAWTDSLLKLCSSKDKQLQHRGLFIVYNIVYSKKELAEKVCETKIFETLMAISMEKKSSSFTGDEISTKINDLCVDTLHKLKDYNLIKIA